MAQPTNTQAVNDTVGINEDLVQTVYNISPVDVPFTAGISHAEATNTTHEWLTQVLAAAANNAAIEGDDASAGAATARVRQDNRTQISEKTARVSGSNRAVDAAGVSDELDYQVLLKGQEITRDIEFAALSNKAKVAGNDTLARQAGGLPSYLVTNTSEAGDATTATGNGADVYTDGTPRALTEAMLKAVIQGCWTQGGNPNTIIAPPGQRTNISEFATNRSIRQEAEDSTLHATFELYQSDFGVLKIIPDRFAPTDMVYVLDMDMFKLCHLPGRAMTTHDIAKTGDSDAKQVLSEWTIEYCQEAASGMIADLS